MKPKSEELLNVLFWAADKLMRPTLRNWLESSEAWECRYDLRNRLAYLEQRQLLQREKRAEGIVYRLTELGRLAALGGRDPQARWARPWDGQWRMVIFDLPVHCGRLRQRLLRWLRQNGFGYLQDSVWIHPDPLAEVAVALEDFRDDVEALTVMEARCGAGYSNEAVVRGAWNFKEINKRYEAYLAWLGQSKGKLWSRLARPAEVIAWLQRERAAWMHALLPDPLLPRPVWPAGYLGEEAWQARAERLRGLASVAM